MNVNKRATVLSPANGQRSQEFVCYDQKPLQGDTANRQDGFEMGLGPSVHDGKVTATEKALTKDSSITNQTIEEFPATEDMKNIES